MVSVVINCACLHFCVKSFFMQWCLSRLDRRTRMGTNYVGAQVLEKWMQSLYLNHALCTGLNDVNV